MKFMTHRAVKSITRHALLISMILHVILLTTLFYFSVRNQPLLSFQDKLDVALTTAPKQLLTKKPDKPPILQQRKTTIYEPAQKPLAQVEAITPEIAFKPTNTPVVDVVTEEARFNEMNTTPEIQTDISTARDTLLEVENGLSRTETAEPAVGSSFGTKRSGAPGVQRRPIRSTLDVPDASYGDDDVQLNFGDTQGNLPSVPYVPFGTVMKNLGHQIVETAEGGPIDVVFVIDASGSMGDNIKSVAEHLVDMVDIYKASGIDYALGLTEFAARQKDNDIEVLQLTRSAPEFKRSILAIQVRGDENALDAIAKTVNEMKFRATSKKHIILVTDEPFTSFEGLKNSDIIALCNEYGIYVNVLGLPNMEHRMLAEETDGKWHAIPQDPNKRQFSRNTPHTEQDKGRSLRKAQWKNVKIIGKSVLQKHAQTPVDIVLFVDGSKSMEDKLPELLKQLEVWVRDWDNALIDYQFGVVRFRTRTSMNIVNVFNPPQKLEQIRKIVSLPCQDNENLLHAIPEGLRRIKLRQNAQTHIILVTDEPIEENVQFSGVLQYLKEKHIIVSVIGTYGNFQQEVANKTGGIWVPMPEGHLNSNNHW